VATINSYTSLEPRFQKAYDKLLERFGTTEFTFNEASEVIKDFSNKKEVISKLEKAGLISIRKDKKDRRKKIYRLEILKVKEGITKDALIRLLKSAADPIRTRVDYRVLLIFLFYKAVSDKFHAIAKQYMEMGESEEESYAYANYKFFKLYDVEEQKLYTWQFAVSKGLHSDIVNSLNAVVDLNRKELKRFKEIIDKTGLYTLFNSENAHIAEKLVNMFGEFDFSHVPFDVLGDAYEWILYYFAPTKAKEGEVYTPIEVSKLMANIIEPESNERILDPACGSGSMLIEQHLFLKKKNEEHSIYLIGQEANDITAVLAELNFILHGIRNYNLFFGDSLVNPKFEVVDKIVTNPPWNQDGYDGQTLKRNPKHSTIYHYGYTTKKSADWAWLQLISHYAKRKAAVVLDSGALFRGGAEQKIREAFIKDDLIDAVILLPERIFYNTQAPGIIIVINKEKDEKRVNKILFINAGNEYIQHPEIRKLNKLSDQNIEKIAEAYREYKNIPGFSRIVDLEEIESKDFNLNVSLYVVPKEEKEEINLAEEFEKMKELHGEYLGKYEVVRGYLKELRELA
jgi:type I restriction enzyme M protein